MLQIRFHGRGGQGVVTAAEILSIAAFEDDLYAQAFPSFGSERTGAPVMAFCRIDHKPIRLREPVLEPDAIVIQDPTLLNLPELWTGVGLETVILINTPLSLDKITTFGPARMREGNIFCVAATEIALDHLKRPMPNAALLGALLAILGNVRLTSLRAAIIEKFGEKIGKLNANAAEKAYEAVTAQGAIDAVELNHVLTI